MAGNVFGIVMGLLLIALGVKAFTPGGLPFGRSRALRGGPAMVIGAVCILLGVASLGMSAWMFQRMQPH